MLRARVVGTDRVVTQEQLAEVLGSPAVSARGRARLRALLARELVLGPASFARVRVGDARIEIGNGNDFPVDWKAFVEVLGEQPYADEYSNAAVLDVGAHKGYFGAYALAHGASFVASFEPAAPNFAALSRASARLRGRWVARNAALGGVAGTQMLQLDTTSWAHSLIEAERPTGEQRVSVVTLAQALAELPRGARRTIVKIDAEGSECDILEDVTPLDGVDLLMVEWHPAVAPCAKEELLERVASRGLRFSDRAAGVLRFTRD
jgi:FkbM family methyltransferase